MIHVIEAETGNPWLVWRYRVADNTAQAVNILEGLVNTKSDWCYELRALDAHGRILAKVDKHGDVYRWQDGRWELAVPSKWWMGR